MPRHQCGEIPSLPGSSGPRRWIGGEGGVPGCLNTMEVCQGEGPGLGLRGASEGLAAGLSGTAEEQGDGTGDGGARRWGKGAQGSDRGRGGGRVEEEREGGERTLSPSSDVNHWKTLTHQPPETHLTDRSQ